MARSDTEATRKLDHVVAALALFHCFNILFSHSNVQHWRWFLSQGKKIWGIVPGLRGRQKYVHAFFGGHSPGD